MNSSHMLAMMLCWGTLLPGSDAAQLPAPVPTKGLAIMEEQGHFQPYVFERHAVGAHDIQIEILYTGICHSDIHNVSGDWGKGEYPMVPGHEIVGRVVAVGSEVRHFKVGDYAGVGCMVNACGSCVDCAEGSEQYCKDRVLTYNDHDPYHNNERTQGGFSSTMVLHENFAIHVPSHAPLEKVAPLLCAGITTYSPLRRAGVKKGDKVGIAGFGGLGHMGVKYALSMGAEVTVFDISEEKRADAIRLGATRYVNVNHAKDMAELDGQFDFFSPRSRPITIPQFICRCSSERENSAS